MTPEKFILILILIPINFMLGGYTSQMLWKWFISPTFGVQELGFLQAVGASLIARYWTLKLPKLSDSSEGSLAIQFIGILVSLMFLGYGYIIHLFM
jgi:hypothetical protein